MSDTAFVNEDFPSASRAPVAGPGATDPIETGVGDVLLVWTEKRPGRGEDAEPLWYSHSTPQGVRAVLAVCDGMGGAGSMPVSEGAKFDPERARTDAYHAAVRARAVLEKHFAALSPDLQHPFPPSAREVDALHTWLLQDFQRRARELTGPPSNIVSRMKRRLPTTVAALYFEYRPAVTSLRCAAVWAGDSRCYALSPQAGLQLLSKDDIKADLHPTESQSQDYPLSNYVNAESAFTLNRLAWEFAGPVILLAATDGAYGFFALPLQFEQALLHTLVDAADATAWATRLQESLRQVAGDDVSLVAAPVGWPDFRAVQDAFRPRLAELQGALQPFEALSAEIAQAEAELTRRNQDLDGLKQAREQLKTQIWEGRRGSYGALLTGGGS